MSEADALRRQVREEILRTAGPVLTIRCEADLQALNKLIRELGSNPLVATQLGAGVGGMQIQVMPGDYDGCGCHTEIYGLQQHRSSFQTWYSVAQ